MAGILGLASLVIPLELVVFPWGYVATWTILGVDIFSTGNYWYNLTQFTTVDQVLNVLILVVVLVGAILLLALRGRPRTGTTFMGMGVAFYIIDLISDEVTFPNFGFPIPLGFFLILAASIAVIGPARPFRIKRRDVAVLVTLVVVFFVFIPAVSTTTFWPPNPQENLNVREGVTLYQAYESPSCAVFGYGLGYWQAQPVGYVTWSYQLGCPPKLPANVPFTTGFTTITSVNSTTT